MPAPKPPGEHAVKTGVTVPRALKDRMDIHAPNQNWSACFCEAVRQRLDYLESTELGRSDDAIDLATKRLRLPSLSLCEKFARNGRYEGRLLATYLLTREDFKDVGEAPVLPVVIPPDDISPPPLFRESDLYKKMLAQNMNSKKTGLPQQLVPKMVNDYFTENGMRVDQPFAGMLERDPWPSGNALWNACVLLCTVEGIKMPTKFDHPWPVPPTFGDSYREVILSLHLRSQVKHLSLSGVAFGGGSPFWCAGFDADGVLASDWQYVRPSPPFDDVKIKQGTRFKDIYREFGGLRDGVKWDDHLANAWAVGMLDEIREMWLEVSTKLDEAAGCSGESSSDKD